MIFISIFYISHPVWQFKRSRVCWRFNGFQYSQYATIKYRMRSFRRDWARSTDFLWNNNSSIGITWKSQQSSDSHRSKCRWKGYSHGNANLSNVNTVNTPKIYIDSSTIYFTWFTLVRQIISILEYNFCHLKFQMLKTKTGFCSLFLLRMDFFLLLKLVFTHGEYKYINFISFIENVATDFLFILRFLSNYHSWSYKFIVWWWW